MGELKFFLRLQIKQLEDGMFINQQKYIHDMLIKFGMDNSKPMAMPMATNVKLTLEGEGDSFNRTKCRGMIGSLLYLTTSRPDIMYSVCLCARFQENPKMSHVEAVKRIFRYLKGTMYLGLWYPKFTGVDIMCFADSDHGGWLVDRKSTNSVHAFVGLCLTSWFFKKKTYVALSTTEAEYVVVGKACAQVDSLENIADIFTKPLKRRPSLYLGMGWMANHISAEYELPHYLRWQDDPADNEPFMRTWINRQKGANKYINWVIMEQCGWAEEVRSILNVRVNGRTNRT
ncbi:uncharacterized mitochondrial protein AtMg00810-like [Rutidosis leptorrhynchoides]|uniref:uncharacterized mitochondrial protein AtMg00810-like n=1 Tax=Rutidosis leptorrhynchoides TaxID=125765 RepID=UPI003A9A1B6A